MMRELVELAGCSAMLAANGVEALDLLASRRPCLMVVDLLMPVMDGIELVEELQRRPDLATIPVIIATSAPHRAPRGMPVLPKPIDVTSLWGWMRRYCRCAQAQPTAMETPADVS